MKVLKLSNCIDTFDICMNQTLQQEKIGTKMCKYFIVDIWHHFQLKQRPISQDICILVTKMHLFFKSKKVKRKIN